MQKKILSYYKYHQNDDNDNRLYEALQDTPFNEFTVKFVAKNLNEFDAKKVKSDLITQKVQQGYLEFK